MGYNPYDTLLFLAVASWRATLVCELALHVSAGSRGLERGRGLVSWSSGHSVARGGQIFVLEFKMADGEDDRATALDATMAL